MSDFKKALEKSNTQKIPGIIAEIKKASPSKGDIRVDLDVKSYAEKYEQAGACAISVLTEQFYFKGRPEDLAAASNSVSIPVLRKDFIISSFQIYEAKALGASSILLINKLLETKQLKNYIDLARELKMEPLVEIHSEWEVEPALTSNCSTPIGLAAIGQPLSVCHQWSITGSLSWFSAQCSVSGSQRSPAR